MNKTGIVFAVLLASLIAGCTTFQAQDAAPMNESGGQVGLFRLRELDPLQISLLGIPEETVIDTVIDEQGNISLPYINDPVPVTGLTTSELERKIQQIYIDGQIYKDVTVNIQTYAKIYYMEGEVRQPTQYSLSHRITLLQAIAAAGGYSEFAKRDKISITRNGQVLWFNGKEIEKHPERDVAIEAGDRIKVHRSWY